MIVSRIAPNLLFFMSLESLYAGTLDYTYGTMLSPYARKQCEDELTLRRGWAE